MSDEFALNLSNEITVIIINHEPYRALTPCACLVEVGKPLAMVFVACVEYDPLSSE
jgi:hypothetical protein